jgi:hypothetical protein
LIAGFECFWILKAKGLHEDLIEKMNDASDTAFLSSFLHCTARYNDDEVFNRIQDLRYGGELSKYINDKNISDMQLTNGSTSLWILTQRPPYIVAVKE